MTGKVVNVEATHASPLRVDRGEVAFRLDTGKAAEAASNRQWFVFGECRFHFAIRFVVWHYVNQKDGAGYPAPSF